MGNPVGIFFKEETIQYQFLIKFNGLFDIYVTGEYIRDRAINEVDGRLAVCYKQKTVRAAA